MLCVSELEIEKDCRGMPCLPGCLLAKAQGWIGALRQKSAQIRGRLLGSPRHLQMQETAFATFGERKKSNTLLIMALI